MGGGGGRGVGYVRGVPASGTFNGNPVGVAAALATLEELSQPGVYARLEALGQQLEDGRRLLHTKLRGVPVYCWGKVS